MDPCRSLVARPGERADDPLTVQRDPEALVAHVALDDVGDRRVEKHLPRFGIVGEELLERGTVGRVADPGVAGGIAAGSKSRPDSPEQLHVCDVPVDVAGSEGVDLLGGAILVEPLRERRAVLERRPLGRVADERSVAVARQLELLDHERMEQADEVRARTDHEARIAERPLERARPTDLITALEHEHRPARAREVSGGGEPVVSAADHDRVP